MTDQPTVLIVKLGPGEYKLRCRRCEWTLVSYASLGDAKRQAVDHQTIHVVEDREAERVTEPCSICGTTEIETSEAGGVFFCTPCGAFQTDLSAGLLDDDDEQDQTSAL